MTTTITTALAQQPLMSQQQAQAQQPPAIITNNVTANATNATTTNSSSGGNITIVEPNGTNSDQVEAMYEQMELQDPAFANFRAMNDNCIAALDSGVTAIPTSDQCLAVYEQANAKYCGLEAYDATKCEYVGATKMVYELKYGMTLRGELP